MIDTSFLDQLARFSLVVNKRVTSSLMGPRKSVSKGTGIMFKEHRIYAPGDDFRSIDWRVYARTDDLYVKTYEEERNLTVHILIDSSASMNFGKPVSKYDYGAMIGVGFAYLAMKENEKFQFATFGENVQVFQPRRGMSQLASMVDYLNNFKLEGTSKFLHCLHQYRSYIGSRSMIILVSDMLVNADEIKEALGYLGDHDVKVIQLLDPLESNLDVEGSFKLKDSETKEEMITYIGSGVQQHYKGLLADHTAKIQQACIAHGYHFHQIVTSTPLFDAFYEILKSY